MPANLLRSRLFFAAVASAAFAAAAFGQSASKADTQSVKSSPAYAEIVLRRTEMEAELESFLVEYTDEYPKVRELRQGMLYLGAESDRLLKIRPEKASALTLALGKLIVRKVDAEMELWRLQQGFADGHPDVKRAKRKLEIFEKAIREILG